MTVRVRIRNHERGVLFRDGNAAGVLGPGVHWTFRDLLPMRSERVEVRALSEVRFTHELGEAIALVPGVERHLIAVRLGATERAIVWRDGRLHEMIGPGQYLYWKDAGRIEVERFDIGSLRFEHRHLNTVVSHSTSGLYLQVIDVEPEQRAELVINGVVAERLGPGRHVFWRGVGQVSLRKVDLRETQLEVAGQEILTADKVTLRVSMLVHYRVTDIEKALSLTSDAGQALYRSAQLALRESVGSRPIDRLLSDKETVSSEVREALKARAAELGLELGAVGLRDIILPGEMRTIFNQVIEAEKRAQAELIRRREETAAARSQANTAKLLAENPVLARFKELEMLREILAGTNASFVLGPGDLADQIKGLIAGSNA